MICLLSSKVGHKVETTNRLLHNLYVCFFFHGHMSGQVVMPIENVESPLLKVKLLKTVY